MNTDPPTVDIDGERLDAATAACVNSDDLTTRAMDWVGVHGYRHATLVDSIVDHFLESPEFDQWAADVADGEDEA